MKVLTWRRLGLYSLVLFLTAFSTFAQEDPEPQVFGPPVPESLRLGGGGDGTGNGTNSQEDRIRDSYDKAIEMLLTLSEVELDAVPGDSQDKDYLLENKEDLVRELERARGMFDVPEQVYAYRPHLRREDRVEAAYFPGSDQYLWDHGLSAPLAINRLAGNAAHEVVHKLEEHPPFHSQEQEDLASRVGQLVDHLVVLRYFKDLQPRQIPCPEFDVDGSWVNEHGSRFRITQSGCELASILEIGTGRSFTLDIKVNEGGTGRPSARQDDVELPFEVDFVTYVIDEINLDTYPEATYFKASFYSSLSWNEDWGAFDGLADIISDVLPILSIEYKAEVRAGRIDKQTRQVNQIILRPESVEVTGGTDGTLKSVLDAILAYAVENYAGSLGAKLYRTAR